MLMCILILYSSVCWILKKFLFVCGVLLLFDCFYVIRIIMIIFFIYDYCEVVWWCLLCFLFDYIDGGVYDEYMLVCNLLDLC